MAFGFPRGGSGVLIGRGARRHFPSVWITRSWPPGFLCHLRHPCCFSCFCCSNDVCLCGRRCLSNGLPLTMTYYYFCFQHFTFHVAQMESFELATRWREILRIKGVSKRHTFLSLQNPRQENLRISTRTSWKHRVLLFV